MRIDQTLPSEAAPDQLHALWRDDKDTVARLGRAMHDYRAPCTLRRVSSYTSTVNSAPHNQTVRRSARQGVPATNANEPSERNASRSWMVAHGVIRNAEHGSGRDRHCPARSNRPNRAPH
jgi:hypothetical protein